MILVSASSSYVTLAVSMREVSCVGCTLRAWDPHSLFSILKGTLYFCLLQRLLLASYIIIIIYNPVNFKFSTQSKNGMALKKVFTQSIGGNFSIPSKKKDSHKSGNNKKNDKDKNKSKKSDSEMVVSANLSSKHNTLVWQLDVFVLLTAMLAQIIKDTKTNVTFVAVSSWQVSYC